MMVPRVSVVIPAYNAQEYISESIRSVLAQTYRRVEIIVVNDGSRDRTPELLAGFGSRIRVIHQDNMGLSGARNTGIRAARGELIAFLDADDLWLPQKTEKQVHLFKNDSRIGFVYTRILPFGPNAERDFRYISPRFHRGRILRHLFLYPFITVSSVMVKKECLDKVCLFDPENPSTQDYDLWMRLAQYYRADFVPEALVRYRVHASGMSRDRVFMLRWILYVIERQLHRTPDVFSDFPTGLFTFTKSIFLRGLILFLYRFVRQQDRKMARKMFRNYLGTYLTRLPSIFLRKL